MAFASTTQNCVGRRKYNVEQALSCKKGEFITIRHIQVRDTTANFLKMTCNDVSLLPLSGESLSERKANIQDSAQVNLSARGFWIAGQKTFFDVRVFNPLAKCLREQDFEKCCEVNEKEKKKHYNERIQNVERGNFNPLVMSANGGFGKECQKFYAKLSEKTAEKNEHYSAVAAWVKRKIMFSLINPIILYMRGSRNVANNEEVMIRS